MPIALSDLVGPKRWARVHKRVFQHQGCIVDIGCEGWEWSRQFLGKKEVYGYGPLEEFALPGTSLCRWAVAPFCGEVRLYGSGEDASCHPIMAGDFSPISTQHTASSLPSIVESLSPISVLKLNVERMEYALLPMVVHPIADQLVVSFHDRRPEDAWRKPWTKAIIGTLSQWYEPLQIHGRWNWWLFLAR